MNLQYLANQYTKSMNRTILFLSVVTSLAFAACKSSTAKQPTIKNNSMSDTTILPTGAKTETATFGTGCFWCTEAVFQELKGVIKVTSGYSGGQAINPTYEEVCAGTTGHAECLQIVFDTSVISFDELLEVFWESHDPRQFTRQGNAVGIQDPGHLFYLNKSEKNK